MKITITLEDQNGTHPLRVSSDVGDNGVIDDKSKSMAFVYGVLIHRFVQVMDTSNGRELGKLVSELYADMKSGNIESVEVTEESNDGDYGEPPRLPRTTH